MNARDASSPCFSIATATVVRPSRLLTASIILMRCGAVAIGLCMALGAADQLNAFLRVVLAAFSFFLGFFGFYHGVRHRKHQHIDISGTGQIRIGEEGEIRTCAEPVRPHLQSNGELCRLLESSTIWPHMLLLRLQTESGRVMTVPIMPDSVSRDSFRALSVACRWIIARNPAADSA